MKDIDLNLILRTLAQTANAQLCSLQLLDKKGEKYFNKNNGFFRIENGVIKELIQENKPRIVTDVSKDSRFKHMSRDGEAAGRIKRSERRCL